jgi:hypothetical protein
VRFMPVRSSVISYSFSSAMMVHIPVQWWGGMPGRPATRKRDSQASLAHEMALAKRARS